MTSRERILAALNHHEPHRVPIDLSGHRPSAIIEDKDSYVGELHDSWMLEFLDE